MEDRSDFYIKGKRDPNYDEQLLENVTFIDTVVAKVQMILMTNKGDVLGDPDFGGDIPMYLWKTRFPASSIQLSLNDQFQKYIPELSPSDYKINVYILPGKLQDIGVINVDLGIVAVNMLYK
jgi:hypothetical protein